MVIRSVLRNWIARGESALRADADTGRGQDEHTVMGPASPRRAPVRIVGRHEGLHVRQGKPGRPVLWRLAAESLDDPGHPRARVHGRTHRPRRVPLEPPLTILAATVLAVESLVFVRVHVKYREVALTILSGVLGLLMAFVAYGRMVLQPIFCPAGRLTKGKTRDTRQYGHLSENPDYWL
jgi:hypothetical protein